MNRADSPPRVRAGFTLIEMLLVVVIIGFAVATATPYLVHSMKGNRLRSGARSIVQAARHARTMAILQQADYGISFNVGAGGYSCGPAAATPAGDTPASAAASPAGNVPASVAGGAGAGAGSVVVPGAAPAAAGGDGEGGPILRPGSTEAFQGTLDRVQIASVNVHGQSEPRTGTVGITYERNGRCTPYDVKLVDEDGRSMTIRVDAVGSIRADDEKATP